VRQAGCEKSTKSWANLAKGKAILHYNFYSCKLADKDYPWDTKKWLLFRGGCCLEVIISTNFI